MYVCNNAGRLAKNTRSTTTQRATPRARTQPVNHQKNGK